MLKVAAKCRCVDTVKCGKRNIIKIYRHFGTMLTFEDIISITLTPHTEKQIEGINLQ